MNCTDVFLLSEEELAAVIANVPNVPLEAGSWSWTRTPAPRGKVVVLHHTGVILSDGFEPWFGHGGVRPAFRVNINFLKGKKPGDIIKVLNTLCTVIGKDVVFADESVTTHSFDPRKNEYSNSYIEEYIHSEEFKKLL